MFHLHHIKQHTAQWRAHDYEDDSDSKGYGERLIEHCGLTYFVVGSKGLRGESAGSHP